MHAAHPPSLTSNRPSLATALNGAALHAMLRHVPTMDPPFDGDCAQANGVDLPIVAINLARRADRWQTLSQRMSAVGLTKLIKAPAIEGARLRPAGRRTAAVAGRRHKWGSAQPPHVDAARDRLLSFAPRRLALGASHGSPEAARPRGRCDAGGAVQRRSLP